MIPHDDQNAVLKDFSSRLETIGIEYMLTGSMALVHYAMPRTTTDIDLVIDISIADSSKFIGEFEHDYYIPLNGIRRAILSKRMFNVLNQKTVIKIDCVIRKDDEFQREVFFKRKRVNYAGDFDVWIVNKEGLILSKLNWAKNTRSEMQIRDVVSIIRNGYDEDYVRKWAEKLEVVDLLNECISMIDENYVEGYDS